MRRAIGLMSGTSLDGIDVAMIETDGRERVITGPALTIPYPDLFRERLRSVLGGVGPVGEVEAELTGLHAEAVEQFLARHPGTTADIVGLARPHDPASPGRAPHLADRRRRSAGAAAPASTSSPIFARPMSPPAARARRWRRCFHAALAAALPKPLAVLNLGGVANVTWIGRGIGSGRIGGAADILAFDTGPGNALIDDWVRRHTGASGRYRRRARRRRTRLGSACRALSRSAFLHAQAAKIARPRRFPRCHARGSFVGRRRRHAYRDDGRRGRGAVAGISRPRPASGWSAAAGDTTRHLSQRSPAGSAHPCDRSKRSAGMAMRSKPRPSPISQSAR